LPSESVPLFAAKEVLKRNVSAPRVEVAAERLLDTDERFVDLVHVFAAEALWHAGRERLNSAVLVWPHGNTAYLKLRVAKVMRDVLKAVEDILQTELSRFFEKSLGLLRASVVLDTGGECNALLSEVAPIDPLERFFF
jgi:hypothetical protein